MSDSNGQETNGREANGQPPTKVRKINFTTNHDEPENSSGAQVTELRREIDGLKKVVEELTEGMKTVVDVNKEVKAEIGFLAEMMGTQNAYLRQILQRGAQVTEAQGSTFPIFTTGELMALDLTQKYNLYYQNEGIASPSNSVEVIEKNSWRRYYFGPQHRGCVQKKGAKCICVVFPGFVGSHFTGGRIAAGRKSPLKGNSVRQEQR
ncbi:hypothetical protein ACLKA6_018710 [Drosophila palustris]